MLAIRLARLGATHQPTYRIVVSDSRKTPRAANAETIGFYDPRHDPEKLQLDVARADYWIGKGAKPSLTVKSLLGRARARAASEAAAAPATA
ncbi:MAG: 30S ribosomal protein S16 [Acidobacteriota bacterium]